MKHIKLNKMRIINFKGIRDLEVLFNGHLTKIYGRNGSGKTTIFDAFVWVLFGKDSQDRKQFDIKTLDGDGVAIPRLPHEVILTIESDKKIIELRRTYSEKWTKKRGSVEETFTGHEEERFYNGVPCSVAEWSQKIEEICPETVFKYITNPHYFTSQKADVQRKFLFEMVGGVNDGDVAMGNADFENLLKTISGKTIEEYKRELAAKKRIIKAEADGLPARIDERKKDITSLEALDYAALDNEVSQAMERVGEIDAILTDATKVDEAKVAKKREILEEISKLAVKKSDVKMRVMGVVMKDYWASSDIRNKLQEEIDGCRYEINKRKSKIAEVEKQLSDLVMNRMALIEQWKAIKAVTLNIDEKDFICPTCGRRFEAEEIESKQAEITSHFNEDKAKRLAANVEQGQAVKQKMDACSNEIESLNGAIRLWEEKLESAIKAIDETVKIERPDVDKACEEDEEWQYITSEVQKRQEMLKGTDYVIDDSVDPASLRQEKSFLMKSIEENNKLLGQRENIARNERRIEELQKQYREMAQALTEIEKEEHTVAEFGKAKVSLVEEKINSLFEVVRFKMFDNQVNGAVVETCEATVGGVPYSALNNAGQILAGLDIIKAICRYYGMTAPIFCDNSEAVNEFPEMESEMVNLYVSEDEKLTIDNR